MALFREAPEMINLLADVAGEPVAFLDRYPEYRTTRSLDGLRTSEYGYLDAQGHIYLDYTGSGLAAVSQYQAHREIGDRLLRQSAFDQSHLAGVHRVGGAHPPGNPRLLQRPGR